MEGLTRLNKTDMRILSYNEDTGTIASAILLFLIVTGMMAGLILIGRRFKFAGYIFAGLPALLGVVIAVSTLSSENAYVAGYGFLTAWIFAIVIALSNAFLILLPRFRRAAVIGSLTGLMLLVSFYATYGVGYFFGYANWNSEMVQIGPNVTASYVVVFDINANQTQINDFVENVLSISDANRGHKFRPGLQSLTAVSVEDREAYSLQWDPSGEIADITQLKDRIKASPIVWRTFENIAPNDIKLERQIP
jgi:hypothetical protein